MPMPRNALLLALAALSSSACGSDTGNSDAAADAQEAACDYSGLSLDTVLVERDDELGVFFVTATSGAAPEQIRMTFDLYFSLGASDEPHSFEFTGESLAECHTCLTIRRDCDSDFCVTGTPFSPQSGSVTVERIGSESDAFAASFADLQLVEVKGAEGDPLETQPVPGGETWCIDALALDTGS